MLLTERTNSARVAFGGGPTAIANEIMSRTKPATPLMPLRMQNDRFEVGSVFIEHSYR